MAAGERVILRVVVGLGDEADDLYVLREAAFLAESWGGHLHVARVVELGTAVLGSGAAGSSAGVLESTSGLHAWTSPGGVPHDLVVRLDEVLQKFAVTWEVHTAVGDPADALLDLAAAVRAYCIVVGSRGEGFGAFLSRLVRPSISRAVLRDSPTRVLVVHPGDPAPAVSADRVPTDRNPPDGHEDGEPEDGNRQ